MAKLADLAAVRYNSNLQATGVHNAKHKFTSLQSQMTQAYRQMSENVAKEIQRVLLERIEETGRPQIARTRRGQGEQMLVKAIVDPENRKANFQGFTVIDEDFMDGLVAGQYYRDLETGTARFVGRQFRGFFVGPGAAGASHDLRRTQGVMIIRGPGGELNEQERPSLVGPEGEGFAGGAYGHQRGTTTTNAIPARSLFAPVNAREKKKKSAGLITIENPIPGYHYIQEGFNAWLASDDELKQTQKAAQEAGLEMVGHRIIPPRMF